MRGRADRAAPGVLEVPAPRFAARDAARLAAEIFGVRGEVHPLESERDQNFRIRAEDGGPFVLKIANPAEHPDVLDFQMRALQHVAETDPELGVPRVRTTVDGEPWRWVEAPDGRRHAVRLLTYLPGAPPAQAPRGPALLRDLGATCARLGRALRGFFHPAAGWELLWDLKHAASLRERVAHIGDPDRARRADRALARFESRALPRLPGLRAQVIHNDVSRFNTLVDRETGRVTGIVDFGDMVHAPLVNDLAVCAAEAMLGERDPIAAAREVAAGYASVTALEEEEGALLFDLIAARVAMGGVISAWRVKEHPENRAYITGDDRIGWALLERLEALDPEAAGEKLRAAAALPPRPLPGAGDWAC